MGKNKSYGEFSQEYLNRWLTVKSEIESDNKKINLIKSIIRNNEVENSPFLIGSGESHGIFSLEDSIKSNNELYVALRIPISYNQISGLHTISGYDAEDVLPELARFNEAYVKIQQNNSIGLIKLVEDRDCYALQFIGAINWINNKNIEKFAILTEDLSKNKLRDVYTEPNHETAVVTSKSNFIGDYFVDPLITGQSNQAVVKKYLDSSSMIKIGKIN